MYSILVGQCPMSYSNFQHWNSYKCSASILSEIVHVLKPVASLTSEHLNYSKIFVVC